MITNEQLMIEIKTVQRMIALQTVMLFGDERTDEEIDASVNDLIREARP